MFKHRKGGPASSEPQDDRLRVIINSISDGFIGVDSVGRIEIINSVALDLLDANNLNGRQLDEVFILTDHSGAQKRLFDLMEDSRKIFTSRDLRLRYPDGSSVAIYLNISPVRSVFGNQTRGGYVVLFRDITDEKSREDEKNDFISVASHELRTPVAIAEGSISNAVLLSERGGIPDTIAGSIKAAHEQVTFLADLINDLAAISRADRGKAEILVDEFDAAELVRGLAEDYRGQAAKKNLEIKLDELAPVKLRSSPLYVREILQNFITNAIKYTESGSITIGADQIVNGVNFTVSDTGIGIGQNEQNKLFGKFFRSEDARVQRSSGTGLGLYVSSRLAKLIGASINMSSELNKGSRFVLHVPSLNDAQASVYKRPKPLA